eukprot:scaffold1065_cov114-Skeletonema_dohrnii-CCMP3373.AAC.15
MTKRAADGGWQMAMKRPSYDVELIKVKAKPPLLFFSFQLKKSTDSSFFYTSTLTAAPLKSTEILPITYIQSIIKDADTIITFCRGHVPLTSGGFLSGREQTSCPNHII